MRGAMGEAVLLLAGGAATRFPGKLEYCIQGKPMIATIFDRLSGRWAVHVAGRAGFTSQIDAALDAPLFIDRWPSGGPLLALLSAAPHIRAERIFAVAADQPLLECSVLEHLAAAWRPGDEAVVPKHNGGIEPLAALYDRFALLREGVRLRHAGRTAMRDLIASLATRFVAVEESYFHNVNRVSDLLAMPQTS
jgi:molybdopterin-guanine dinucleotide biosynthesis protein A